VHGSYIADILPGLVVMALGLGAIFVGVQTAANAGVSADNAGLAAALGSASAQLGSALGLAIFTAIATSHTEHLVNAGVAHTTPLTSGFHYGLVACSIFLVVATRANNGRHQAPAAEPEPVADAVGG
jgi:hypothetical protein